jgi:hypothetical protein
MNFVSTLERMSFPSDQQYSGQGRVRPRREGKPEDRGYREEQERRNATFIHTGQSYNIVCKWEPFREQILHQWDRLTARELDEVGPNRSKLAMLIENRYGIAAHLVENYLRNFERTLPLI